MRLSAYTVAGFAFFGVAVAQPIDVGSPADEQEGIEHVWFKDATAAADAGDLRGAIELQRRAVERQSTLLDPSDPHDAFNLALSHGILADWTWKTEGRAAQREVRLQALALLGDHPSHHALRADCASDLYEIEREIGEPADAERWARVALDSFRETERYLAGVSSSPDPITPGTQELHLGKSAVTLGNSLAGHAEMSRFLKSETETSLERSRRINKLLSALLRRAQSDGLTNLVDLARRAKVFLAEQTIFIAQYPGEKTDDELLSAGSEWLEQLGGKAPSVEQRELLRLYGEVSAKYKQMLASMQDDGIPDFALVEELSALSSELLEYSAVDTTPTAKVVLSCYLVLGEMCRAINSGAGDWTATLAACERACLAAHELAQRERLEARAAFRQAAAPRQVIDPFAIGQVVSRLPGDVTQALRFASWGRGLGTRVAGSLFATEEAQAEALRSPPPPAPQWMQQVRQRLQPNELLLFFAAELTIAGEETGLFVVRPSGAGTGVSYYPSKAWFSENDDLPESGATVLGVLPHSVAKAAGLQPMDVILTYGGEATTPATLATQIAEHQTDERVAMRYWRAGAEVEVEVAVPEVLGVRYSKLAEPAKVLAAQGAMSVGQLTVARDRVVASLRGGRLEGDDSIVLNGSAAAGGVEPEDAASELSLSHSLFRLLMPREVWSEVAQSDRVFASLPGALQGLPLETLVTTAPASGDETGIRWIDVGPPIIYLPAGPEAFRNAAPAPPRSHELDFAGVAPVAFPESDKVFPRFVAAASRSYDKNRVRLLLGDEATPAATTGLLTTSRHALIFGHGTAGASGSILERGLELSGGRLTLRDLVSRESLPGRSPEIVALIACNSGKGEVLHDEGSFGIPFAFLASGTRGVIASPWQVAAKPSSLLVTEALRQINAGASPSAALHDTKRALRAGRFRAPRYWAPYLYLSNGR